MSDYRIFNEDCLEGMKKIADGSVDLIATDPPYCVGASSNGVKSSFSDFNLLRPFWEQCFGEWQRILKDGGHVYCCTDWRTYPFLYPIMIKYFRVRNLIVWDFNWAKAGNWYRPTHEFIMFATKGECKRKFPPTETDVWKIRCINYTNPNKLHGSEKPIELMEKMIVNSTAEGELVLDSFLGSGTTAVAAINLNRRFIGYEIDEKYYEIAKKRMIEAMKKQSQKLF